MIEKPIIIKEDCFVGKRFKLRYVNCFKFTDIKRFYFIENYCINKIRT